MYVFIGLVVLFLLLLIVYRIALRKEKKQAAIQREKLIDEAFAKNEIDELARKHLLTKTQPHEFTKHFNYFKSHKKEVDELAANTTLGVKKYKKKSK